MADDEIIAAVRAVFRSVDWREHFSYRGERVPDGRPEGQGYDFAVGVRMEMAAAFEAMGEEPEVP